MGKKAKNKTQIKKKTLNPEFNEVGNSFLSQLVKHSTVKSRGKVQLPCEKLV